MIRPCAVLVLLLLSFPTFSQNTVIVGLVTDKNNTPIGFARIDVVGRNNTTFSDDDGNFTLSLTNTANGDIILVRATKKGYNVFTREETVSRLLIKIKLVKEPNIKKRNTSVDSTIIKKPNYQIAYVPLNDCLKSKVQNDLSYLAQRYKNHPITAIEIEAGNNGRNKVALELEGLLSKDSLGVYANGNTFIGRFPDNPISVFINPQNKEYCNQLLKSLKLFVTGEYKIIEDERFPANYMRIYFNGQPLFDSDGRVKIE
jgi:hypothetical protein